MKETLTGRTRFRTNWRGKVILQVEIDLEPVMIDSTGTSLPETKGWRDAIVEDLTVKDTKGELT